MGSHFTAEFFAGNRKRLRQLFHGTAPIVITANGLVQRNGDTTYPFRQDSNFWYLTGLENEDTILVIDRTKEYLIVPARNKMLEIFDGKRDVTFMKKRSGIDQIFNDKEGWKLLGNRIKKVKHIATLTPAPAYLDWYGFFSNPARTRLVGKIKSINHNIELLDLRPHLARMRIIKQENELQALKEAIKITTKTLKEIKRNLSKYESEYEIVGEINGTFWRLGANGHAYPPIVASGKNATIVHYIQNNAPIGANDLILFDIGAEVQGYAADISRTYARSTPTKRQRAVFQAVKEAQAFAFDRLKPGLSLKEFETDIAQFMGEKLRELSLIKSINKDNIRKFYPHATSHMLGLDVHDVAESNSVLSPGMVLTVEPGIYIPKEGIGVRLEDDVLVTDNGIEIMSASLPRELD